MHEAPELYSVTRYDWAKWQAYLRAWHEDGHDDDDMADAGWWEYIEYLERHPASLTPATEAFLARLRQDLRSGWFTRVARQIEATRIGIN